MKTSLWQKLAKRFFFFFFPRQNVQNVFFDFSVPDDCFVVTSKKEKKKKYREREN